MTRRIKRMKNLSAANFVILVLRPVLLNSHQTIDMKFSPGSHNWVAFALRPVAEFYWKVHAFIVNINWSRNQAVCYGQYFHNFLVKHYIRVGIDATLDDRIYTQSFCFSKDLSAMKDVLSWILRLPTLKRL